jgi:hypothetical protein
MEFAVAVLVTNDVGLTVVTAAAFTDGAFITWRVLKIATVPGTAVPPNPGTLYPSQSDLEKE